MQSITPHVKNAIKQINKVKDMLQKVVGYLGLASLLLTIFLVLPKTTLLLITLLIIKKVKAVKNQPK